MARDTKVYAAFIDRGGATVNLRSFNPAGDGVTDDRQCFIDCEAAGDDCTAPHGTYLIGSNLTLTKRWEFRKGAILKPANGVAITINGGFDGDLSQHFDLSLGGTVVLGSGAVGQILPEWWGAVGDGSTDSSGAIQEAIGAGREIYISQGTYMAAGLVTTRQVKITGPGTLKMPADSSADHVLKLAHDGCIVEGITVDGNKSAHTSYAGRGEGIRVDSDKCILRNVAVNNTPDTGTGDAFSIWGDDNLIESCSSDEAGYSAFRNRGNRNRYVNIRGINWRQGGWICDDAVDRADIDGAYFTSDTTVTSCECILVDPDTNGQMGSLYLNNVRCDGPNSAPATNNVVKLVLIKQAFITNCEFLHTTSNLTTLRIQEGVDRLYMRNVRLSRELNFDGEGEVVIIEDCVIGLGDAPSTNRCINECKAREISIRNTRFYNYTNAAVRLEAGTSWNPRVMLDNAELEAEASSTTATVFSIAYTPNPGEIKVGNVRVIVGSTAEANMLSGVTGTDALIQRNLGEWSRIFRGSAAPSTGTWQTGDQVLARAPTAGGVIGWVCVSGGTPGTWKSFGNIAA